MWSNWCPSFLPVQDLRRGKSRLGTLVRDSCFLVQKLPSTGSCCWQGMEGLVTWWKSWQKGSEESDEVRPFGEFPVKLPLISFWQLLVRVILNSDLRSLWPRLQVTRTVLSSYSRLLISIISARNLLMYRSKLSHSGRKQLSTSRRVTSLGRLTPSFWCNFTL